VADGRDPAIELEGLRQKIVTGGRHGRPPVTDISADYITDHLTKFRANQTAAGRFLGSNDVSR
jgi:hypothetical protein